MADQPRYLLTLEYQPHDIPAAVELRRVLRYALRTCGLRCVDCCELPAHATLATHTAILPKHNLPDGGEP